MAQSGLPQARFVQVGPASNELSAVYDPTTDKKALQDVVIRLGQLPGVRAMMVPDRLDGRPSDPVMAINVRFESVAHKDGALSGFRDLVDPIFPISIDLFTFELLLCPVCRSVGSLMSQDAFRFVQGFEPEDLEGFWLRFVAGVKRTPVARLVESQGAPPFTELARALEEVLNRLGAWVREIRVEMGLDHRSCKHSL